MWITLRKYRQLARPGFFPAPRSRAAPFRPDDPGYRLPWRLLSRAMAIGGRRNRQWAGGSDKLTDGFLGSEVSPVQSAIYSAWSDCVTSSGCHKVAS
jgi:hypothetical protein